MNEIRIKRHKAGHSLKEVATLLGRSYEWLRTLELGRIQVSPEIEAQVLKTIEDLANFKHAASREGLKIFIDRKLPRRISNSGGR